MERALSPLQELALLLQNTDTPQKILFTGHWGSGKSTELAKLTSLLQGQFFVVGYSVKDVLDLPDLKHMDLILSLAMRLVLAATGQKLKIKKEVLSRIYDFTKEVT